MPKLSPIGAKQEGINNSEELYVIVGMYEPTSGGLVRNLSDCQQASLDAQRLLLVPRPRSRLTVPTLCRKTFDKFTMIVQRLQQFSEIALSFFFWFPFVSTGTMFLQC